MTTGTVEMVSVEWIMQNLYHSVDGFTEDAGGVDFAEMIHEKACDRGFGDLCYTIATKGFRVPIVIDKTWEENGLTQGNGHHRLSAAILMVLDEIPVYWSEGDYMSSRHSDTEEPLTDTEWSGLEDDMYGIYN